MAGPVVVAVEQATRSALEDITRFGSEAAGLSSTSATGSGLRSLLIISAAWTTLLSFGRPSCVVEAIDVMEYAEFIGIECGDVTLHSYSGIATPEACQAKCDAEMPCRAFSFSVAGRECYLKQECSHPRKREGYFSSVDKTLVASSVSDENSQMLMAQTTVSARSNELNVEEAEDTLEDATSPSSGGRIVVSSTWAFPALDANGLDSDDTYAQNFRSSIQTSLASAAGVPDNQVSVALLEPVASAQGSVEVRFPSDRDVASFAVQLVSAPSSLLSAAALQNYGHASVTNVAVTLDLLGDLIPPPPSPPPPPSTPAPTTPAPSTPAPTTLAPTPSENRPGTPVTTIPPTPSPTAAATPQAPNTAPTPAPTAQGPKATIPTTTSISRPSPTAAPSSISQTTPPPEAPTHAPANPAISIPATAPPMTDTHVSELDERRHDDDNQNQIVSEMVSPPPSLQLLATSQHDTPPPPRQNTEDLEQSSPSDSKAQSFALIRLGIFGGTALLIILSCGAAYCVLRKREQDRSMVKEVTVCDGISSAITDKDIEGHGGGAQAALQQLGATSDSSIWGLQGLGNIRSSMDGSIASSSLVGTWHGMLSLPGAAPARERERSRMQSSLAGTSAVTGSGLDEDHCDEAESSRLLLPRWWGGPSPWWVADSDRRPEHPSPGL